MERAPHSVDHILSLYFVNLLFQLFTILFLRAGFGFCLFQFLVIAYLLLLLHISEVAKLVAFQLRMQANPR